MQLCCLVDSGMVPVWSITSGCPSLTVFHSDWSKLGCCLQGSQSLDGSPGFNSPEAANAWFGHNPEDKRSGGMEVVDEQVLAAATLPQHIVQQMEADARPKSPKLSSESVSSIDDSDMMAIDMPEQSGKLKAQKYRKSE